MNLQGKTVLVTRRQEQSGEMTKEIERLGGTALVLPMIDTAEPDSWSPVDRAIGNLSAFDLVVFASANAVERFLLRTRELNVAPVSLQRLRMLTVGEKTREALEQFQLHAHLVPSQFSTSGLLAALGLDDVKGKNILIPRGNRSSDELPQTLSTMGASVECIVVYKTVEAEAPAAGELHKKVLGGQVDIITFASPSAVRCFAELFSDEERRTILNRCIVAVIGPTTGEAAHEVGLEASVVARESTGIGLIHAVSEYYR